MEAVTSAMRREAKECRSDGIKYLPGQALRKKSYDEALVRNVRCVGKPGSIQPSARQAAPVTFGSGLRRIAIAVHHFRIDTGEAPVVGTLGT